MDIKKYFERIKYTDEPKVNFETLSKLHQLHLYSIPFENLSIHWKQPIVLDKELLFDKLVNRNRGGFCYEQNGVFAAVLKEIGFDVEMLSAEVYKEEKGFGPEFDHMILLIKLDKNYIADVGFGDSFIIPLELDKVERQTQPCGAFKILTIGEFKILHRLKNAEWVPQYRFKLTPHDLKEYEKMCEFHQTSPESHFTQKRICSIATPTGRKTLSEFKWIETSFDGIRNEKELASEEEIKSTLLNEFRIIK